MIEQAAGNQDIAQLGVINIGGIANISLFTEATTLGFDIGPGNTLMDEWSREHIGKPYDANGDWARTGDIDSPLLQRLLLTPTFSWQPPRAPVRTTSIATGCTRHSRLAKHRRRCSVRYSS